MLNKKTPYLEMHKFDEDSRIHAAGTAAMMAPGKKVGLITDAEPGKSERYCNKIAAKFPDVKILGVYPGPVEGTVLIAITRPTLIIRPS
jgi:hypothetical protein